MYPLLSGGDNNPRFLLAAAVDCAESVNHRSGVHANDFARRKTFFNDSDGALIIAMAEDWNHHRIVAQ